MEKETNLPYISIKAKSIPEAHYKAVNALFLVDGMKIRTQYDRKENGEYIDPPSKDASVSIHISNPYHAPRFPRIGCSQIGEYYAEMFGAKDHWVIPAKDLQVRLRNGEEIPKEWSYTYNSRLRKYPDGESTIDQIELALNRLAENPITRRAVAITGYPSIDCLLKEDIPCLRELDFRCSEIEGELYLNMSATWRSRDLWNAWADNTLALTFLQQKFAKDLEKKINRTVNIGSYNEFITSLHIYGKDHKNIIKYLTEGKDEAIKIAKKISETAKDSLILFDLNNLLGNKGETWHFTPEERDIVINLKKDIENGVLIA